RADQDDPPGRRRAARGAQPTRNPADGHGDVSQSDRSAAQSARRMVSSNSRPRRNRQRADTRAKIVAQASGLRPVSPTFQVGVSIGAEISRKPEARAYGRKLKACATSPDARPQNPVVLWCKTD